MPTVAKGGVVAIHPLHHVALNHVALAAHRVVGDELVEDVGGIGFQDGLCKVGHDIHAREDSVVSKELVEVRLHWIQK